MYVDQGGKRSFVDAKVTCWNGMPVASEWFRSLVEQSFKSQNPGQLCFALH